MSSSWTATVFFGTTYTSHAIVPWIRGAPHAAWHASEALKLISQRRPAPHSLSIRCSIKLPHLPRRRVPRRQAAEGTHRQDGRQDLPAQYLTCAFRTAGYKVLAIQLLLIYEIIAAEQYIGWVAAWCQKPSHAEHATKPRHNSVT